MCQVGAEAREIISRRSKVVVNHVEQNGEASRMAGIDQPLQSLRAAVSMVGCEDVHTVVAPSAIARKLDYRHQLDVSDTKVLEMAETIDRGIEGTGCREGANMHFVYDRGIECGRIQVCVAPVEARIIVEARAAVHAVWLRL